MSRETFLTILPPPPCCPFGPRSEGSSDPWQQEQQHEDLARGRAAHAMLRYTNTHPARWGPWPNGRFC